jgi:hypothetical protein
MAPRTFGSQPDNPRAFTDVGVIACLDGRSWHGDVPTPPYGILLNATVIATFNDSRAAVLVHCRVVHFHSMVVGIVTSTFSYLTVASLIIALASEGL